MRIFISLAIIILLSIKIRAKDDEDKYADSFIKQSGIRELRELKESHTSAALSEGIQNAEKFPLFFQRLSDNFMEACKAVENAQFFVAAVQPSFIAVEVFDKIMEEFDQRYQEHPFRLTMREELLATRDKFSEYGAEIAPFTDVPTNWFNETTFGEWTQKHEENFKKKRIDKKLAEYLKHVNNLIISIQRSIAKSRGKIEHRQLKRLGTKIMYGFGNFMAKARKHEDLSSSLEVVRKAIDELRNYNNGKYFNDMMTNARKILDDLDQLKLLMEKQWTDMDYIFRMQELPQQLPTVTLAN